MMNTNNINIKIIYFGSLLFCLLEIAMYRLSGSAVREADFFSIVEKLSFYIALILHLSCLVILIVDIFKKHKNETK